MLPVAVLAATGVGFATRRWAVALACLAPVALVALIVAITKILFLGFGWGVAALDFTGASGHSMLAFAVYPMLAYLFGKPGARSRLVLVLGAGTFAMLIAVSRVVIGVHSVSEVWAGTALGTLAGVVSIVAMRNANAVRLAPIWLLPMLVIVLASGLASHSSSTGPAAHGLITRLALAISGHDVVFTREDMHRGFLQRRDGDPEALRSR